MNKYTEDDYIRGIRCTKCRKGNKMTMHDQLPVGGRKSRYVICHSCKHQSEDYLVDKPQRIKI